MEEAGAPGRELYGIGVVLTAALRHMVSKPTRRAPLINRGYYSRVKFIRKALSQFLDSASTMAASKGGKEAQVVCLGAGMDTAWWCLKQEGKAPGGGWFEVDFRDVRFPPRNPTLFVPLACCR